MARVLIIEDDPALRANMVRGIAKLADVVVVEAATMHAALTSLDEQPPDFVISDIDLPDRSGIELLGELGRRALHVPVLFVSAYLKAYGPQIPPHAHVDVLEKPVGLEDLRSAVLRAVAPRRRDSVAPPPFGVADYVQLATMGRHSVSIRVLCAAGEVGRIVVYAGEVWAAVDPDGEGDAAFGRLAFAAAVRVECHTLLREPGERNFHGHWEGILLDAARVHDEDQTVGLDALAGGVGGVSAGPGPGGLPTSPPIAAERAPDSPVATSTADAEFEDAWEDAVAALLVRNYAVASSALQRAAAIRPNDARVAANLKRLRDLGHLPCD